MDIDMHVVWRRIWDDIFIIFYHFKPVGQYVGKIILTQLVSEWVENSTWRKGKGVGLEGKQYRGNSEFGIQNIANLHHI